MVAQGGAEPPHLDIWGWGWGGGGGAIAVGSVKEIMLTYTAKFLQSVPDIKWLSYSVRHSYDSK